MFKLPLGPYRPIGKRHVRPLSGGYRAKELMLRIKCEREEQEKRVREREEIEALQRAIQEQRIKMEQEGQKAESAARLNRSISQLELAEPTNGVKQSRLDDGEEEEEDSHSSTDTDIPFFEEEDEEGSDDDYKALYYW